uniref:IQ motif containing B1 n=1 Tax=Eptatretus burgeri TaxID=7764 RepID=A0A8C4PZP9_EPTBU
MTCVPGPVLSLASCVADAADADIPRLLLQLEEILADVGGGHQVTVLKRSVWAMQLLHYCSLSLRHEHSHLHSSWINLAQLARIISSCCVGLEPDTDVEEFYIEFLPTALDNMLLLAQRLHAQRVPSDKNDDKEGILRSLMIVLDSMNHLVGSFAQLAIQVVKSNHLLELLMSSDAETFCATIAVYRNALNHRTVLTEVGKDFVKRIMEELVSQLLSSSLTQPREIELQICALLLAITKLHHPSASYLTKHNEGLSHLLTILQGVGHDEPFSQLLDMLNETSAHHLEVQQQQHASTTIQSAWRAHQVRRRLKLLTKVVTFLQRTFRARRKNSMCQREENITQREEMWEQQRKHRRAQRASWIRRLKLLQRIPASELQKVLKEERHHAATLIQATWRAWHQRKIFQRQRPSLLREKAARIIQQAVRKFLHRVHVRRQVCRTTLGALPTSHARHLELRAHVEENSQLLLVQGIGMERCSDLHKQAQCMFVKHALQHTERQKRHIRRQAMLAQLHTDAQLLMSITLI